MIGLAGIRDELRPEVKKAVEMVRDAGIQTVMITGDNGATAQAIGELTDRLAAACEKLEKDLAGIPTEALAAMHYCHDVLIPDMEEARQAADQLETLTASEYWPFPTYSDLLFSV